MNATLSKICVSDRKLFSGWRKMREIFGTSVEKAERHHLTEVVSTQDEVRVRLEEAGLSREAISPWHVITVVTAEHQTAGRGRRRKKWVDTQGALLLSAGFADDLSEKEFPARVGKSAAAALLVSVQSLFFGKPHTAAIKWPNDLVIGGRKVAGLLVETFMLKKQLRGTVLGIGVNVTDVPKEVTEAVALNAFSPEVTKDNFRIRFLQAFDVMLASKALTRTEYESGLVLPARVQTAKGEGKPISYDGGIITVETKSGRVELTDADIISWEG